MPRFQCEVSFGLSTTIEFDGDTQYAFDTSEVEDYEDNSYFRSDDVSTDGGEVSFVVEAEDEDEAEAKAADVVSDGAEVEDSSSITWVIENVHITVEKIEEPMTLERAIEILSAMADEVEDEDRAAAITFVLAHVARLTAEIKAQQAVLTALQAEVAALSAAGTPFDAAVQAGEEEGERVGEHTEDISYKLT